MRALKGLLQQYTNLKAPNAAVRNAFIQVVKEVIGVTLSEDMVVVKYKSVHLRAPATLKTEIQLHKKTILKKVQDTLSDPYCVTTIY